MWLVITAGGCTPHLYNVVPHHPWPNTSARALLSNRQCRPNWWGTILCISGPRVGPRASLHGSFTVISYSGLNSLWPSHHGVHSSLRRDGEADRYSILYRMCGEFGRLTPGVVRAVKDGPAKKPAAATGGATGAAAAAEEHASDEAEYVNENRYRTTSEEKRHMDNLDPDFLVDYRHAAETHRQVRQWAQKNIKPGQTLTEIANGIEDSVRALVGHQGRDEGNAMVAGMGFPTGLNLNHIAAHYSPNAGNKMVLGLNDVMKVDIGVHVNGRIVDSAFTVAFEPKYDNLLAAVKDATNTGLREAGIDVRLGEIGAAIQETMESYEVEIDGNTYPVKSIRTLNGHTIERYSIHGSKSVPIVKTGDTTKMEEGDVFAIETFGSTGNGYVHDEGEVSHYAKKSDAPKVDLRLSSAKSILNVINKNFGTIHFCRRYLDRLGQEKYLLGVR